MKKGVGGGGGAGRRSNSLLNVQMSLSWFGCYLPHWWHIAQPCSSLQIEYFNANLMEVFVFCPASHLILSQVVLSVALLLLYGNGSPGAPSGSHPHIPAGVLGDMHVVFACR